MSLNGVPSAQALRVDVPVFATFNRGAERDKLGL